MGLLTWIVLAVVILAIIGLGWQVFFSGIAEGAEKVLSNPAVKKATNEAQRFVANATDNITSGFERQFQPK
jgi:hypothetical protein